MSGEVRVVAQDYHRNGVGGVGFVVSLVEWSDPEAPTPHFVAISFYGDPDETQDDPRTRRALFVEHTAVLQIDLLSAGVIEMYNAPQGNAWRGADYVGPSVADAWQARCRSQPTPYDPFDDNWEPTGGA